MSNEPKNSPLMSAWRGALVLCGIAVLLKVTVELLRSVWPWLVAGAVIVAVIAVVVVIVPWRQGSNRW